MSNKVRDIEIKKWNILLFQWNFHYKKILIQIKLKQTKRHMEVHWISDDKRLEICKN